MPLNIPRTLQTLLTDSASVTRALASVKSAVDPLLSFVNTTFAIGQDGALSIVRRVGTFAADSIVANSSLVVNGQARVNGSQTISGDVSVGGNAAVTGNTTVNGNQTVVGATSSSTGFKTAYYMGIVYSNPSTAGTRYQAKVYTQSDQNNAPYNAATLFQPPFAGSIVGISVYSLGSAGGTVNVQLFKNSISIAQSPTVPFIDRTMGSAASNVGNTASFAKGLYPFAINDYFSASASWSAAGNQFITLVLWLELTA